METGLKSLCFAPLLYEISNSGTWEKFDNGNIGQEWSRVPGAAYLLSFYL